MTQRDVAFPVPPDVARDRLISGLGTSSKARFDGDTLTYESVVTTNFFGVNHFNYEVVGRLESSPAGSMLRVTVTDDRRSENRNRAIAIAMIVLGCLAIPVALVLSGKASVVAATWVFVISTVVLGTLIIGGFLCASWFSRELVANNTARQLQDIVASEPATRAAR